ncbi:uncharacterized protein LOC116717785 isoform X3 [Xiphophorus hellerii]|uniref:uncharacterized protein LOC116717785 isoform X3 n=1 Tax=Xiphophorus hellerii TaxID=8084 RepID=UPI0013B3A28C|nr:uncharacterized protein LOC116717785 isoform X3 [Xiphophorus hellerii]
METSELLAETLKQLSLEEFAEFRTLAEAEPSLVTSSHLKAAKVQDVVDLMVKSSGGCVEAVRTVLMKMDRLDLVERLSATDSGAKDKLSVGEEHPSLDQRVEKLSRDFYLLLETLKDLSDDEVQEFKRFLRDSVCRRFLSRHQYRLQETSYPRKMFGSFRHEDLEKQPIWMESKDLQDVVIFIIQTHRKESIMVTRDVLERINRMDLVQRLSSSSASREMPLGKQSDLIHKVATMAAAKDVLLETLEDLNEPEFMELKLLLQFTNFQRNIPLISWDELYYADRTRMVEHLVDKCGKQSVDVIREVLLDLNRTDLALRLPETSSTSKEKLSLKLNSAYVQKVEKLEFVTELLLETLGQLRWREICRFLEITNMEFHHDSRFMPFWAFPNVRYIVVGFVLTYFHQSVKKTLDALKEMKKDGLIKKLSDRSSGPKEKPSAGRHRSALIHKVATMAAARQQLLETLDKLTQEEFLGKFRGSLSKFSPRLMFITQRAELVDKMMVEFGQQSVKMIKDLLIKINRKDLAENLQETGESSGNEDDFQEPSESDVHQNLSEILQKLSRKPLLRFKSFLRFTCFEKSLPQIPESSLEEATSTQRLVDLMVKEFGQQSVQMAREVLMDVIDLESRFKSQDELSVAEEHPSLDQRIEKLSRDFNLLLETLKDLSDDEVQEFKRFLRDSVYRRFLSRHQYRLQETSYPRKMFGSFRHEDLEKQPIWMESKDLQDVVIFIIQTHRKESIMVTRDVLERINRMDLVQRLSSSSASREMPLGKQSDLIHKVATMAAARDVLLETLEDLNEPEFMELKLLVQFTNFQRNIPLISWHELDDTDRTRMVEHLVNKCGKQSVDVIREVLLDLNRTDLALRLPETSSTSKEKLSLKLNSAYVQKVEKLEFVTELLLETLGQLRWREIRRFLEITNRKFHHDSRFMPFWAFPNVRYIVVGFVLTYFHQSVKKTLDALKEMKKDGLIKKLSDRSSGPKEKPSAGRHRSALIHKVATMAAARQQLLETLDKLTQEEFLGKFKGSLSKFLRRFDFITQRAELVDVMMMEFGQQSVKMIKDLLIKINRKDLAENLQETGELLVDGGDLFLKPKTTTADVHQDLFEILHKLNWRKLVKFQSLLQFTCFDWGLKQIPDFQLDQEDNTWTLVVLMVKEFGQRSVEIARQVLTDMTDLDQNPLEVTSKGIPMEIRLKQAEPVNSQKDSSSWTKVEPEMKTADPDEAPAYSLQSEAGHFECSVSGLRWFCSERVVFRYRFCSWDELMDRMESRGYRPAGPILDIGLITGRMAEVFLPHWICVDDVPEPLEQFAVLHMDDCGDAVEKVSEVSPSHVKLTEPVFSPRAVLMRVGFPVKVYCNMLLYRTNTAFLTLHVYLIPRDPALQQEMDQREKSYGYKVIRKPDPDMPLKMSDDFVLTADLETAEVCPERLKLRYDPTRPNFFEVYIKNPDTDFQMKLSQAKQPNPVWSCALRKDEYQNTEDREAAGGATGVTYSHNVKHHVDEHPSPLTQKVNGIPALG